MPLIDPVTMSGGSSNSKTTEWMNKLAGKKLGDSADTTTFAKKELPKEHRVVPAGSMVTMDHKPDRMNVHLAEDGTVSKVTHG